MIPVVSSVFLFQPAKANSVAMGDVMAAVGQAVRGDPAPHSFRWLMCRLSHSLGSAREFFVGTRTHRSVRAGLVGRNKVDNPSCGLVQIIINRIQMAKVTFDWGSDLSSDDEEDAAAAGGGSQEEDPGGQEEDSGAGLGLGQEEGEPSTPTNARPRLVQRTISVTCGLGSATNESPRVKVSFHKRRFPSSARKSMAGLSPNFKYTSLRVWARRVVSSNGRAIIVVSPVPPPPVLVGTGKWWNPVLIE